MLRFSMADTPSFRHFVGESPDDARNLPGDWLLCEPEKVFEEYSESAAVSAWKCKAGANDTLPDESYGGLHKLGCTLNRWFIRENTIKIDDFGKPPFMETLIYSSNIFTYMWVIDFLRPWQMFHTLNT